MNRKDNINNLIENSFNEVTNKMSEDDQELFYESIINNDNKLRDSILKKYGYMFITPVENTFNDEQTNDVCKFLLKVGLENFEKNKFNAIGKLRDESDTTERMCPIPLSESDRVLSHISNIEKKFYAKESANKIFNAFAGENATLILKAAMLSDAAGCLKIRNDLIALYGTMLFDAANSKAVDLYKEKKIISADRSKAKKGKTNRHYSTSLKIALDTWSVYPNASIAGLAESLSSHLRLSWNDAPVAGTIQTWLKESGLNPDVKPKNRKFELVINKG